MVLVRVKFTEALELGLAPPGWHQVTCRKAITETSKNDNPMYVLDLSVDGYKPFRVWLLLPGEDQAAYAYNRRLADINAALKAFEVPATEGGLLPWPGTPSREWSFAIDDFTGGEAKLWVGVKPAEKGYAARNFVEWRGRP